ncbi:hypothetical protein T459_34012 [Capsicum annuum]|uniref:DYW domain-containing protein n=1 Tax=Capsicum annuum TaxID=4072 RepID=A0A2G2XXE1_CAPAN|nr:hypothetical protein T459_34012 [Capsicum annuum]
MATTLNLSLPPLLSTAQQPQSTQTPTTTTTNLLQSCKNLNQIKQLHAHFTKHGYNQHPSFLTKLITKYSETGSMKYAQIAFDNLRKEGYSNFTYVYNVLIKGYWLAGLFYEALLVFARMVGESVEFDGYTFPLVLSVCAKDGRFSEGVQVMGLALKWGFGDDVFVLNSLIHLYGECGEVGKARKVFDKMSERNLVSWTCLINGYVRKRVYGYIEKVGLKVNTVMVNALVDMYMKCGSMGKAKRLLEECVDRNLVLYNTALSNYVRNGMVREALEVLGEMLSHGGPRPDRVTLLSSISASTEMADVYFGKQCHAYWIYIYIEKYEIYLDMQLSTALVDMFARCGDPANAMKVFNKMKERDVSAWTATIGAMAMEGNGKRAIKLFYEMLREGVEPDHVVFVAVLTACSHGGLVGEGMEIFRRMKEIHGISPQIVHYGCIVDMLGRAGLLKEAVDIIKNMPMEPNDAVWGAFLAACKMHKNDELATYAIDMISESSPDKAGIHVLLSNIYALRGKWTDVAKVRMSMKERGIKKNPGSSSIEVNGNIHEFTSGDEFHPEHHNICLMLDEMNCRVGEAGHVPDLTNVFIDVDEQEKEFLLNRHSEKIAMAYGLISTTQGHPIRIVKNLRMCSDCHSFAKFVSKVYDRHIVVRDNNRFHFFQGGLCSCGDYW